MVLPRDFYLRTDILQIAKDLLGKELISTIDSTTTSGIIVETEAYRAPEDLASHASGNRMTPRNCTMFSEGGHAYVYISYGIHHLFNIVTAAEGIAHAVLVRAIEPLCGIDHMLRRRNFVDIKRELVNGPGKFTKAMGISIDNDRTLLYKKNSPIRIEESDYNVQEIVLGPRVGMSHHTKECGHWPWRFRIKDNKWTSKPDFVKYDW